MTVSGTVKKIRWSNQANGWSVVVLQSADRRVILVGYMGGIREDSDITAEGGYENNAKYGLQFRVSSWHEDMPVSEDGICAYLSDGKIDGVGPVIAKRIVDKFGTDTLNVLDTDIGRLSEVEGIGKGRLEKIRKSWLESCALNRIYSGLCGLGISMSKVYAVYEAYGPDCVDKVQSDPYRLVEDIDGIGFKTADRIALNAGIPFDSYKRLRCGIVHTLKETSDRDGNCYLDSETLITESMNVLNIDRSGIEDALVEAIQDGTVILENGLFYFPMYYYTEIKVAERLKELSGRRCVGIAPVFDEPGFEYDPVQMDAVKNALACPVYYITGGPGTGKTTIVKAIINSIGNKNGILLAAPTGRAAKRLEEATGMPASTIHRLLEYAPDEGGHGRFRKNADDPLDGDFLIVDECSMIDLMLMNSLLSAIPAHMRLILVGDADQLPSVGPGTVLRDIIASGRIPGIRLNHIFRQDKASRIIVNAHRIINGYNPDMETASGDYRFIPCEDMNQAADAAVELAYQCCREGRDVQVLSPQKNTVCGVNELNVRLQERLNPNRDSIEFSNDFGDTRVFHVGDRVMQTKNNYEKNVFNGDVGYVVSADRGNETLTIRFGDDGEDQCYTKQEALSQLILAYAATVHKSQGSEYEVVIMVVMSSHKFLLNRNLFYTGVTRAKKMCYIIGQKDAVNFSVHKTGAVRNTTLAKRIADLFNGR